MGKRLDLLLGRKRSLPKRAISLLRNHTASQVWNRAKYEMRKFGGFNSTYLRYEPAWLVLFITKRCNLSCKMCPSYRHPSGLSAVPETVDMPIDVFEWIINRFNRAIDLTLTGGEPFLHSNIFEMIDYAHQHRMRTRIPTNGIALHNMLDRVAHSPLWLLNISLNACNSEEFFELHGGSEQAYNTLLEDISKLAEMRNRYNRNLRITISYICTKANYRSIPNMVELAEGLGVDEIDFLNLIPHGIPGFLPDQCLYDDDSEVIEVIKGIPSPKSNLEVVMPRLYKRRYVERRCNFPFLILPIHANGDISPCCQIAPQRDYGNVFTDKDVWNNSTFRGQREIFTNESLSLPDFCKTCHGMVAEWRPDYITQERGVR
jgi:MoaA/NifB/PqqE/SkfB family radical SAM enzyme